jgi:hypothetical protein
MKGRAKRNVRCGAVHVVEQDVLRCKAQIHAVFEKLHVGTGRSGADGAEHADGRPPPLHGAMEHNTEKE